MRIALKIIMTNRFAVYEVVEGVVLSSSYGQYQGSVATVVRLFAKKIGKPITVVKQDKKGWY